MEVYKPLGGSEQRRGYPRPGNPRLANSAVPALPAEAAY